MGTPLPLRISPCFVRPELVGVFAEGHDAGLSACLCRLLKVNTDTAEAKVIATLVGRLGPPERDEDAPLGVLGQLRPSLHD